MESRVAVLEQIARATSAGLDRLDRRFETMERRFDTIDRRFEVVERRLDSLAAEHRADFRWLLGVMLGGFGGLLGVMAHGFHWL